MITKNLKFKMKLKTHTRLPFLKKSIGFIALMMPFQLHAAVITTLTWNDATNGNVTSSSGDGGTNADIDITEASTLVSFQVGTDTFTNFVGASSAAASGNTGQSPLWGANATDLTAADDVLSITDNRIDTGFVNMANNGDFFFPSGPTSLNDVLFIFDVGSSETVSIELLDASNTIIGTSFSETFSGSRIADIDYERVNNAGTSTQLNQVFWGRSIEFSNFGITAAQLSSIDKIRIDGGTRLDPSFIGIAFVPEPSSALLLGFGSLAFIGRRRRY